MIEQKKLSSYLRDFLACEQYKDYAPNGLQVEGKSEIQTLCTAVTASMDAIEKAVALEADALLVHHGYFWRGESANIVGMKRERIRMLLSHDINLFAYHLPLDGHITLGNNAEFSKLLGIQNPKAHKVNRTPNLLWTGEITTPIELTQLADAIGKKLNRKPFCIEAIPAKIKSIAWCTGAAQDFIADAYDLGADVFISGEVSERTYYQAKELGINYLACGHHATERYGVQALGAHLSSEFNLKHQYIDSLNPV